MLALEVLLPFKHLMMATTYRQSADKEVPNTWEQDQASQKANLLKMSYIKDNKCFSMRWTIRIPGTTTRVELGTRETQLWCFLVSSRFLLSNLRLTNSNHKLTLHQVRLITRLREWSENRILPKQESKLVLNILLVDLRLIGLQVLTQGRGVGVEQVGLEEMQITIWLSATFNKLVMPMDRVWTVKQQWSLKRPMTFKVQELVTTALLKLNLKWENRVQKPR